MTQPIRIPIETSMAGKYEEYTVRGEVVNALYSATIFYVASAFVPSIGTRFSARVPVNAEHIADLVDSEGDDADRIVGDLIKKAFLLALEKEMRQ